MCGGVFSLTFVCGYSVAERTFFGTMVCRSPSFESDKTDLAVNPSFLAVTMRKLFNLLNLSFLICKMEMLFASEF